MTPVSCCIRLTASTSDQISTIRPHSTRKMLSPVPMGFLSRCWQVAKMSLLRSTGHVALEHVVILSQPEIVSHVKVTKGRQEVTHHSADSGRIHLLWMTADH